MVFIRGRCLGMGVPEDTTLDAFLDADATADEEAPVDSSTVEDQPAESTAAWSATPVECPRCDADVHRRYRTDDGRLVCSACKRW